MNLQAIKLSIISILSSIIGFVRDMVSSYILGTSYISDAYYIAMNIPDVFFAFIGKSISTAYIPAYSKVQEKEGEEKASDFSNNFLNILLLISLIIFILIIIFTKNIILFLAPGIGNDTLLLAIRFTKVSSILLILSVIIYIFTAYLNLNNKFVLPALLGFPLNLFLILGIFLSYFDVMFLIYGCLFGYILQTLILLYSAKRNGYRYKIKIDFLDNNLILALGNIIPIIIGTSSSQFFGIIDRMNASQYGIGIISSMNYATRLNLLILNFTVVSIITVIYPSISKFASLKKYKELGRNVEKSIKYCFYILMPLTVLICIFSYNYVDILFGRGAFNKKSVQLTSELFKYYSLGLFAIGVFDIISRTFFALGKPIIPMMISIFCIMIKYFLNYLLIELLGISGLSLSTSISVIIMMLLSVILYKKMFRKLNIKLLVYSFIRILFSCLIMMALTILLDKIINKYIGTKLSTIVSSIFALTIFYLITRKLDIKESDIINDMLKKIKIGKKS